MLQQWGKFIYALAHKVFNVYLNKYPVSLMISIMFLNTFARLIIDTVRLGLLSRCEDRRPNDAEGS